MAKRRRATSSAVEAAKNVRQGPVVYAISDSTGTLARHMLATFLTQFPAGSITLRIEAFIRAEAQLRHVLDRVKADAPAVVCHAVVAPALKSTIEQYCKSAQIPTYDLTGPAVKFIADHTGINPRADVDALHRLDQTYDRRIEALEFAMNHDDGLGLDTLREADIVLTGVSRTSKTPTSVYLAQQGYLVGNVSLAMGVPPPQQLLVLPRSKVTALMIGAQQLAMIRARRQAAWNESRSNYDDPDQIEQELAWARRLFNQQKWQTIDVTDQAIEETAARVMAAAGIQPSA